MAHEDVNTRSARDKLLSAGLRPTRQRVGLAALLFAKGPRHVTAEELHAEVARSGERVSLATVYNNLRAFTDAGLVNYIAVDGGSAYFDTNAEPHHHFYDEQAGVLIDIPADAVTIAGLPDAPEGAEIARVDVVVRLRPKGDRAVR